MRKLSIRGHVYEINNNFYLNTINSLAQGYTVLAKAYHDYHFSGFADINNIFELPDKGQYEFSRAFEDQIDDIELSQLFHLLKTQLQSMKDLDTKIIIWLANYVGIYSVNDKKERKRLDRRLRKIIFNGANSHPQGPIWIIQPEYQVFIESSKKIKACIDETNLRINRRIKEILDNKI